MKDLGNKTRVQTTEYHTEIQTLFCVRWRWWKVLAVLIAVVITVFVAIRLCDLFLFNGDVVNFLLYALLLSTPLSAATVCVLYFEEIFLGWPFLYEVEECEDDEIYYD